MAKKAKRRGRPPGAKSPDKMDIGQLRSYIDKLETLLKEKVSEQRAYLEDKLSELSSFASAKAAKALRGGTANPVTKSLAGSALSQSPGKHRKK